MSKALSEYARVRSQYNEAKRDFSRMIGTVYMMLNAIKENPTRDDIEIGRTIPIVDISGERARPIVPDKKPPIPNAFSVLDKNEWPDAKQIRNKLGILNDLFSRTNELFSQIPISERESVTPPDEELRVQALESHK